MDNRFKLIFLLAIIAMTGMPLAGILRGTSSPPVDPDIVSSTPLPGGPPVNISSVVNSESFENDMVFIPAGEFIQGTNSGGFNEKPERVVWLDDYWIDRYEVTNVDYLKFVDETGHRKPGPPSRYAKRLAQLRGDQQPITYVSWHDADAYCHWLGKRLPTESEWEKAMRGIDGRLLPWGNSPRPFRANLGGGEDGFESTSQVGSFPQDRSPFGVHDGLGNLMEWVADWYREQPNGPANSIQSNVADRGGYKTLRGSGYTSFGSDLRLTNRSFMVPDFRDETIGFRCVRSKDDQKGQNDLLVESIPEDTTKENRSSRE